MGKITVFKSIESDSQSQFFEIDEVLDRIKRGINKSLIEKIRSEKNENRRSSLKKQLMWICFSGEFSKRNNESIIQHSGFICLDFDKIEPQNFELWRRKIEGDKFTFACFTSPSGNGLKVIYQIPECSSNAEHNLRFDAISKYWLGDLIGGATSSNESGNERKKRTEHIESGNYNCRYFDYNIKGWSRVCFESYDPKIYVNKDAEIFEDIAKEPEIKTAISQTPVQNSDVQRTFDNIVTWFERSHNMRKGNRNAGAFTFATGVANYLRRDEAEPMLTNYIMSHVEQLDGDTFSARECETCINQAYRNNPFPTKRMDDLEPEPNRITDISISSDLPHDFATNGEADTYQESHENIVFWERNSRGTLKVDYFNMKRFLEANGFFKYRFNPEDISFIRIEQNIVKIVTVDNIRDFILCWLEERDERAAYNLFASDSKFKKEYLALLAERKPKFIKDTKHESWVFYRNTAVKITRNGLIEVPYIDLSGFIWERQMLDRDFKKAPRLCDFATFIMHVSHDNEVRARSLISGIGYMLHRYKDPSTVKALIANEEIISSEPMGGTGKTLMFLAMSKIRVAIFIDGKTFDINKTFVWQRVNPDTEIVVIDDTPKSFRFETIFSILTTGWPIEKKNKGEIFLPPEDSPKIGIPTNNVLKGLSDSHERRKFEVEFFPYYSAKVQPIDEFGKPFFTEWSEDEWARFDNFMLGSIELYLREGLIQPEYVNLAIKKLMAETSDVFVEFAKIHLEKNKRYHRNDMYKKFQDHNPGAYCKSANQFYDWMRHWGEYNGWPVSDSGHGKMYIEFGNVEQLVLSPQDNEEDLPF